MADYVTTRRVEFSETDMAGIVHFANFFRWMEEAEHEFFRSVGLSIMRPQGDGSYIGWPRVSASCHFHKPLRYEDSVEVRVFVERIGVKSLVYRIELWRDDVHAATGRIKVACCICRPGGEIEAIEIPDDYRRKIPDPDQAGDL